MLDFPSNPNVGDTYERWEWDGSKWICAPDEDGGGIGEAPMDGQSYVRNNGQWVVTQRFVVSAVSPPPAPGIMWFDGDFHTWTGTAWAGIEAKSDTVLQDVAPTAPSPDLVWFTVNSQYRLYLYQTSPPQAVAGWYALGPPNISVIRAANSPPASDGQLWFDGNQFHIRDGVRWIVLRGNKLVSDTPPANPDVGQVWGNRTLLEVWDGARWVAAIGDPLGPPALDWTLLPPSTSKTQVVYANGKFTGIGPGGVVSESVDGLSWTQVANIPGAVAPSTISSKPLQYNNGVYILAGSTGIVGTFDQIARSTDGINWTRQSTPNFSSHSDLAYGAGKWVTATLALFGTTPNSMYSTDDGVTWTAQSVGNLGVQSNLQCIAFGNGMFAAAGAYTTTNLFVSSPDGINWTARTNPAAATPARMVFGNGVFVAVAGTQVITSTDGMNWSLVPSPPNLGSSGISNLAFANGLFVVNNNSRIATSSDGVNWTVGDHVFPLAQYFYGLAYGAGRWVFVTGANLMISP